jgi:Predicted acetyltransferases and hydrolases with the alpha/beta hydrolase fold
MKATRWITVAALLCCAGIRLQAQDYDTWRLHWEDHRLSGPSRQLLLVHGIFSSSATWDALTLLFRSTGDTTWHVFRPNLYTSQPFAVNRDSLVRYMVNKNLANDVAVVGHSMGGLIGRLASRSHPTQGILTIGTPHYGAPDRKSVV